MTYPTEERFREVFNVVAPHIESKYGIPIIISDVPSPFTGDLDGAEIKVDYDETVESAVFIVAHLFGHTVQWNLSPEAREIGSQVATDPTPATLARLREYEIEACRYSLALFHEAEIRDLDQWLSDFASCDFAYLDHFYRTGEKADFHGFWMHSQPLLTPLSIPHFLPTQWKSRWSGIVV
jgi:hypothetical protein